MLFTICKKSINVYVDIKNSLLYCNPQLIFMNGFAFLYSYLFICFLLTAYGFKEKPISKGWKFFFYFFYGIIVGIGIIGTTKTRKTTYLIMLIFSAVGFLLALISLIPLNRNSNTVHLQFANTLALWAYSIHFIITFGGTFAFCLKKYNGKIYSIDNEKNNYSIIDTTLIFICLSCLIYAILSLIIWKQP